MTGSATVTASPIVCLQAIERKANAPATAPLSSWLRFSSRAKLEA